MDNKIARIGTMVKPTMDKKDSRASVLCYCMKGGCVTPFLRGRNLLDISGTKIVTIHEILMRIMSLFRFITTRENN